MPHCEENYHIFKGGTWLPVINGCIKEPGKQDATRREFCYKTGDSFTLIPYSKVLRAMKYGFTNNAKSLSKPSFRRKYKNLQRKNRRFVRQMEEMKRKLERLQNRLQAKKKRDSSFSGATTSDISTNSFSSESALDRKLINKMKSLWEAKKNENETVKNINKNETLPNERQNQLQMSNADTNLQTKKKVIIPYETIEILTRFGSKHRNFLKCNQENIFQNDEDLPSFLCKINPIVCLENMNLYATVMKNNISHVTLTTSKDEEDKMSLEDFAAKLGLVNVGKANLLKHIHEKHQTRTCEESDEPDSSSNSVPPMDRLMRTQKGPFRSEKQKALADSMSKRDERPFYKNLRRKLPVNYTVSPSYSGPSTASDSVRSTRQKTKINNEKTQIIKFTEKSPLDKKISAQTNNSNEKQAIENVSGKKFVKAPFDENCDYLKNLQKDLQNLRKKETASKAGPLSSTNTTKQPDIVGVLLLDKNTSPSTKRVAGAKLKQHKKVLQENNKIEKGQIDLDAIEVYNGSSDQTDAENMLEAGKRTRRSQPVSYLENRAAKPYSMAEDTFILNFILKHGYESKVNGNFIWKKLETRFAETLQEKRTWQSLRNRYLRNILRNLNDYSLPPDKERKLRIASCLGSGLIKVKSYSSSPVQSVWNAGRRKQQKCSDELLKKGKKVIKANDADAPVAGPSTSRSQRLNCEHLTYNQTINKFSRDHDYSDSDGSFDDVFTQSPGRTRKKLYTAVVH